jgi:UDP-GlcNAc:undecaprenyl-phosphate GlcNAc-1-phosphate transferase
MSNFEYLLIFLSTAFLSALATLIIKRVAVNKGIVDRPSPRKIHNKPTPLLGGVAIFIAFFLMLILFYEELIAGALEYHHWLGFFAGAVFLMIGGFLDDKYDLSPKYQIIWPILAVICVIAGGVEIRKISDPGGGLLYLDQWKILLWQIKENSFYLVLIGDLLIFFWLMGMMYTTKLLDGVDGLVTGLTAIGGAIIFLFTTTTEYYQPDIALASLIFTASCLGFLIFNWNPAKIFLGEGGSLLLGYILAVLAIISGGKVAIALLVMGVPILDAGWTILRRIREGKNPFKFPDKKHLHHRLLKIGLSQKQTVIIFYLLSATFGIGALFLQTEGKIYALVGILIITAFLLFGFGYLDKKARD